MWRDMNQKIGPDAYVMTSASFGDEPAGNIAIVALRKTAEMAKEEFSQEVDAILKNSYIDDIADSVKEIQTAVRITNEVDGIVKQGGFEKKQWFFTSVSSCDNTAMSDQSKPDASFSLQESNMLGDIFSSHQPLDSAAGNGQKILGLK